jgi:hypothetical protein
VRIPAYVILSQMLTRCRHGDECTTLVGGVVVQAAARGTEVIDNYHLEGRFISLVLAARRYEHSHFEDYPNAGTK